MSDKKGQQMRIGTPNLGKKKSLARVGQFKDGHAWASCGSMFVKLDWAWIWFHLI